MLPLGASCVLSRLIANVCFMCVRWFGVRVSCLLFLVLFLFVCSFSAEDGVVSCFVCFACVVEFVCVWLLLLFLNVLRNQTKTNKTNSGCLCVVLCGVCVFLAVFICSWGASCVLFCLCVCLVLSVCVVFWGVFLACCFLDWSCLLGRGARCFLFCLFALLLFALVCFCVCFVCCCLLLFVFVRVLCFGGVCLACDFLLLALFVCVCFCYVLPFSGEGALFLLLFVLRLLFMFVCCWLLVFAFVCKATKQNKQHQ